MLLAVIVQCSSCSTRYHLDDDVLGSKGSYVRCTSCRYVWYQEPPIPSPYALIPLPQYPLVLVQPKKTPRGGQSFFVLGLFLILVGSALAGLFLLGQKKLSSWLSQDILSLMDKEVVSPIQILNFSFKTTLSGVVCYGYFHNTSSTMRYVPPVSIYFFSQKTLLQKLQHKFHHLAVLPGEKKSFYLHLDTKWTNISLIEMKIE